MNLDLEDEVHSIWVRWRSGLQEGKGHAKVGLGQACMAEVWVFWVLSLPARTTSAMLVGGI